MMWGDEEPFSPRIWQGRRLLKINVGGFRQWIRAPLRGGSIVLKTPDLNTGGGHG